MLVSVVTKSVAMLLSVLMAVMASGLSVSTVMGRSTSTCACVVLWSYTL
jgi:hypothetical protein